MYYHHIVVIIFIVIVIIKNAIQEIIYTLGWGMSRDGSYFLSVMAQLFSKFWI